MKQRLKEMYREVLRHTPIYLATKKNIEKDVDVDAFVERRVREAIRDVPYYANYSSLIAGGFDLKKFPVIRKKDLLGKEHLLVAKKYNKRFLRQVETGGSTGDTLKLYRSVRSIIAETAFIDYVFSLIGKNLNVAVLRGQKPKEGIYEELAKDRILLSSYAINAEALDAYLDVLRRYRISCIHAYPSSLMILSRLIKSKYGKADLPCLKGIFTSSEIFSKEDKEFVREVFPNVRIVDYYGHNEQVCCAYSVDGRPFHFFPQFGFVEFLDTGEISNGHRVAEIVATSVMNRTMPFIRYGTEDYVELDDNNQVVSIIGRTSDFIVNKKGDIVPCIVSTRPFTLQNVTNFQYYQEKEGELRFRVVVAKSFSEKDVQYITEDLRNSFDDLMDCVVDVVPFIERTKRGKQKRLVQKLDLKKFQ